MKSIDEMNKPQMEQAKKMMESIGKRLINERKWPEYFKFIDTISKNGIIL